MEYSKQVITIVNHGTGEKIASLTREAGARGGTILVGRGTRGSMLMQLLMLADVEKDILIILRSCQRYGTRRSIQKKTGGSPSWFRPEE